MENACKIWKITS